METNTSREELVTKTRKPYTITKQRERWTEDEHNRFLEALRLYGRAWQRIEEHIGTKTAVQIRSHAQKFFTKLEKDAQAKGIPVCQALDIEIPPPRPKRKPSTPYPRKPVNGTSSLQVFSAKDAKLVSSASSSHCNQALDLEKEPLTEPNGVEKVSNGKENHDDICSGVSTRPLEAHCASISSVNRYYLPNKAAPRNPSSLRELEPSLRKATADNGTSKTSNTDNSCYSQDNADKDLPQLNISRGDNGVNNGLSPADNMNRIQNYPWLFPMHVLNGSVGTCPQNPPGMGFQDSMFRPIGEVHGHSSGLFTIPATSATTSQHPDNMSSSSHQAFPTFHPAFVPACHTQDDYRSFLQISSTFSNLIVSTLLQNPAAHAAASFAASFWPYANVGSSNDSSTSTIQTDKAFSPRQMNSPPSLTAIAAATVAAATAWWAAHGLLPICAPFTCSPISAAAVPPSSSTQIVMHETDKKELSTEIPQQGETQVLASKSPASSSDDSEENGRSKQNTKSNIDDHKEEVITVQEDVHDSNTTQKKKLVDRSSCGSNTPSGSDIETDALEKVEKDKEEKEDVKENDANQTVTDSTRRNRSNKDNSSDSWKEVSEEGRMAFEALFTRERLPQSFSRMDEKESEKSVQMANNNNEIRDRCSKDVTASMDEDEGGGGGGVVTIGLGPGKSLKTRRTGFKPYKRCSMEAKETRVVTSNGQTDENVSKRIRLEGEASTT